jgi:hypothetical protein
VADGSRETIFTPRWWSHLMPVTRETTAARQLSGDRMRSATIGVASGDAGPDRQLGLIGLNAV